MSGDASFTPTRQPPVSGSNGHTSGKTGAPSSQASSPATGKTNGRRVATNGRGARTRTAAGTQDTHRALLARLRDEACERARPQVKAGAAPIRVMARMVAEIEAQAREAGIPDADVITAIVNRTIGDVDLRRVSPVLDGAQYVSLADDMGLALPGEMIAGQRATGETYRWIHESMLEFERELLARHFDLRMYDIAGVGNPLLRAMLIRHAERHWGFTLPAEQIYLSLGALDGLDKFFRGFAMLQRQAGHQQTAVMFPAPSFNVPEWQAQSLGLRLHRLYTRPEDHFKVTPDMLAAALAEAPDIRAFYLTVSNNPTAFAYTPAELRALFDVLLAADRMVYVVADLAYIGTGDPNEDRARMLEFNRPEVLERSVLVSSFSKTHTLTGDRCGWVGFGDARFAAQCGPGWTNSTASLPAEWQLRYMAYLRLFAERPELGERIRALYHHRRGALVRQLQRLNTGHELFAHVNLDDGGTVYNWSQLQRDQDVFSLFSATGIAGVPGSAFGYSDDFVRLSVGCIPVPAE